MTGEAQSRFASTLLMTLTAMSSRLLYFRPQRPCGGSGRHYLGAASCHARVCPRRAAMHLPASIEVRFGRLTSLLLPVRLELAYRDVSLDSPSRAVLPPISLALVDVVHF